MARTPRDLETREHETRGHDSWRPASLLPTPNAEPGVAYRWIRTSAFGQTDARNVSSRLREGWVPVKASDHPELNIMSDPDSRFKDGVEVGGLLLCKTDRVNVEKRREYYAQRAADQLTSVDHQYLRENDPRMRKYASRKTRTTFGNGDSES